MPTKCSKMNTFFEQTMIGCATAKRGSKLRIKEEDMV
jgi:hypothetical protein